MVVYHASYTKIKYPDVSFSRDSLDFGKGFYVTTIREQAIKYAEKFKLRGKKAILNTYELDDQWRTGRTKSFDSYNEEWLDFVATNRSGQETELYDAVEGGIANDKVFRTLDLYFAGDIGKKEALSRLVYEKPNNQICLLNQAFIDKRLTFLTSEEL